MSLNTSTTAIGTTDVHGSVFGVLWGSRQLSPFWGGFRPEGFVTPPPRETKTWPPLCAEHESACKAEGIGHKDCFDLQVCVRRLLVVAPTPLWLHAKNVVGLRSLDSGGIAGLSFVAGGAGSNIVILIPLAKAEGRVVFFVCDHDECAPRYFRHLPAMSIKTTLHATAPLLYPCRRYPKCPWGLYASPPPIALEVVG